jgi:hypothetical protein
MLKQQTFWHGRPKDHGPKVSQFAIVKVGFLCSEALYKTNKFWTMVQNPLFWSGTLSKGRLSFLLTSYELWESIGFVVRIFLIF